jgi:hypothetical protein
MKFFLPVLCFAGLFMPCSAQKQWDLRLQAGYDFSSASQYLLNHVTATSVSSVNRAVNSSFGRGPSFSADVTRWMNNWFGVTAGGRYHITGPAVKGYYDYNAIDYSYRATSSWHSHTAIAMAGIALKIPDTKLHPYARMGVLLPVYAGITENADWSSLGLGGSSSGQYKKEFRVRNTAGYTASAGIAPKLGKHMSVFAEINLQSLSILARRSELISYKQNDVEKIGADPVYAKKTDYVKKLDAYRTYSADEPSQELTFSFPYSSIGIHIGVSFKL